MSITKHTKVIYKTDDGREFNSEKEARSHELYLSTRGALQSLFPAGRAKDTVTLSELAALLLANSQEFAKNFGLVRQRQTLLNKVN